MKIQETTISDQADGTARVEMQISAQKDVEPSSDYVAFSVVVSTEARPPIHDPIAFRILQTRALKQAVALLDQADDTMRQQQP